MLEKAELILFPIIFKDRIMVKLLRILDLKESWETISTLSYRCNQRPKKINEPKPESVASEFLSRENSISPSYTFGVGALQITNKFLPLQAILRSRTYGQNSYVTSSESLQLYFQYISPYYSTSWGYMGIHYSINRSTVQISFLSFRILSTTKGKFFYVSIF